jgi:hypothetical protein
MTSCSLQARYSCRPWRPFLEWFDTGETGINMSRDKMPQVRRRRPQHGICSGNRVGAGRPSDEPLVLCGDVAEKTFSVEHEIGIT